MDLEQLQTSTGTVAARLLDALSEAGVDRIFGNPGTTELPLLAALAGRPSPRYVMALHDGVAVGMAHGYAQAGRRLGVVNLHAAPGLANAMGNLYNAHRSGVPLLVTAGQVPSRLALHDPPLAGDLVSMARPVTKWAYELRRAGELVPALRRAIHTALTPPAGPVFLGLPVDLLEEPVPEESLALPRAVEPGRAEPSDLAEIAREILEAGAPLMVVGERAARAEVQLLLVELAELLGVEVRAERIPPRLAFPTDHPLWAGPLPAGGPELGRVLGEADLLLVVGASRLVPVLWAPEWDAARTARQVRFEESHGALLEGLASREAVVGPFTATLRALVWAVRQAVAADPALAERLQERRTDREAALQAERSRRDAGESGPKAGDAGGSVIPGAVDGRSDIGTALTAESVAAALEHLLPADSVVVEEALTSTRALLARRTFRDPEAFHGIKGTALGWGLPAAVGVKLARPERTVLAFVGDGSVLYSFQALWTAARERLKLPVVILRNGAYRILKEGFGETPGRGGGAGAPGEAALAPQADLLEMRLGPPYPDYVELARGLGAAGRRVRTPSQLDEGLTWALAEAGPAVLEVWIDGAHREETDDTERGE
ncbi:thiamine pyrophosphate-binding protein [Limnochorda pilosa]|uniref:Benzoylformate decarboxylase n=1 Tax=Limnochorda pilosa TaxID=1555112 RepID=A0A0K2SK72_LIMPI|nr:thiamine pyrophosphate-binding protein [Limnochorda pilosa]BAS27229.1 benzoylformate decarboxylase [Limnochorda pilosa]